MASEHELTGPDFGEGIRFDELVPGVPMLGHANGEAVIVVREGDEVFAIGAKCSHWGGPLSEGLVIQGTVRCPWHHGRFELATGKAVAGPPLDDLPCYVVEREGDTVKVTKPKKVLRPQPPTREPKRVVIVGAGAAGVACAQTLRALGYDGELTMVSAENSQPVDRPNLSKDYLAGVVPEEFSYSRSRDQLSNEKIELISGVAVPSIDPINKRVALADGSTLDYDALLLATGSEPLRLKIPGAELPHVRVLRTHDDCRAIIDRAHSTLRAVVLGSSFIGLEVAASLRQRGLDVDVVSPDTQPLGKVLGDELGRFVRRVHEKNGVRFHLKKRPVSISDGQVTLSDGKSLKADLVIMGVGVRPRTELCERAGIKLDKGVVVDEHFATNVKDVYAAGDIARFAYRGELARIEHWVVAERQGQAVARSILGLGRPFQDAPYFWTSHFDVHLRYSGHAARWDSLETRGSLDEHDASFTFKHRDKVLALVTVGRDQESLAFEAALESGDQEALRRMFKDRERPSEPRP